VPRDAIASILAIPYPGSQSLGAFAMELEFHQIDLRFEPLRRRDPRRERLIAASMAAIGQQTPVVVVAQPSGSPILVDGFKRLRALRTLRLDLVQATCWDLPEQEASGG